ncbi:MAG: hypothetical protein IKX53_04070, partial [Bacteroidales bacterium]|nr:hypothetical protein [Bacteroidales bacterium]
RGQRREGDRGPRNDRGERRDNGRRDGERREGGRDDRHNAPRKPRFENTDSEPKNNEPDVF